MTQNRITYRLFLDDIRNPRYFGALHPEDTTPLLWARDVEQATAYVKGYGMPVTMYLDHDLGEQETTMDFLKWCQQAYPNDPPRDVRYLTANPIGEQNMRAFISSWQRASDSLMDTLTRT